MANGVNGFEEVRDKTMIKNEEEMELLQDGKLRKAIIARFLELRGI